MKPLHSSLPLGPLAMGPHIGPHLVRPVMFRRSPKELLAYCRTQRKMKSMDHGYVQQAVLFQKPKRSILPRGSIVKTISKKQFADCNTNKSSGWLPSILRTISKQHFPMPRGSVLRTIIESRVCRQHFPIPRGSVLRAIIESQAVATENSFQYTATDGTCKTS